MTTTTTFTVSASADDGYFFKNQSSSSAATTYSSMLNSAENVNVGILFDGDDYSFDHYQGFFRFQNIAVAQGATISSAYLKPYFASGTERSFKLYGYYKDNISAPSAGSDGNHTNFTTAGISDFVISSTGGQKTSPDIKTIVQEIVDRPGWSSGNAMMFGMYFQSGVMYANRYRTFRGYDYSSGSEAAELVIEYEGGGGGGGSISGIAHKIGSKIANPVAYKIPNKE